MSGLLSEVDPDGLLEYSVVYTDRSVNHMSSLFQESMREISRMMKSVYHAESAIVVPGSGTFGMEAIARQFASDQRCLVIRNGLFSFRWSQILEVGRIASDTIVLKARKTEGLRTSPFSPVPIAEVVDSILRFKPGIVFAPHVETSSGMILPDEYLKALSNAVHAVGGMLVLDCVASGALWVDMEDIGVDVLLTAPQKGWSGPPCCAMVALGRRARDRIDQTVSSSFSCDLRRWLGIMETYERGGHAYHATPPTDSLVKLCKVMKEMEVFGYDRAREAQVDMGTKVRSLLYSKGFPSVVAAGFEASGVIVCYTDDPEVQSGLKFSKLGLQIAPGVPIQCDEGAEFRTFRIGLFGLEKLRNVERTVSTFQRALDSIVQ